MSWSLLKNIVFFNISTGSNLSDTLKFENSDFYKLVSLKEFLLTKKLLKSATDFILDDDNIEFIFEYYKKIMENAKYIHIKIILYFQKFLLRFGEESQDLNKIGDACKFNKLTEKIIALLKSFVKPLHDCESIEKNYEIKKVLRYGIKLIHMINCFYYKEAVYSYKLNSEEYSKMLCEGKFTLNNSIK